MSEGQPSDYVVFDAELRPGSSDVIVFTPSPVLDQDGLRDTVRAHFDRRAPPDRVFLLATSDAADVLLSAANEGWIHDTLKGISGPLDDDRVVPLTFDRQGGIKDLLGRAEELGDTAAVASMMRCGLHTIFERNFGLLESGPGYHFVNPSGVHTTAFIRVGEILRHSAEIGFVALQLLRWWPDRLRNIYVDTAAISSVAYALVELRRAFEPDLVAPTIDSFSSYEGVGTFRFRAGGLCLLSASISGGLEDVIRQSDVDLAGVITLFYGGRSLDNRDIVCDLVARTPEQSGIDEIESFSEGDCDLCDAGQGVVRFSGDQFLPASPRVNSVMIRREDQPPWLSGFLEVVVGRGAARCHETTRTSQRDLHLQLDTDGAFAPESPLAERFERLLLAGLPANLSLILHTDDEPSRVLAHQVAERYRTATGNALGDGAVIAAADAVQSDAPIAGPESSVAVVTAVVGTGRALLRLSQILRQGDGAGAIVYFVGVSRLRDAAQRTRIESNLSLADLQGRFRVVTAAHAFVPHRASPWDLERRLFESLSSEVAGGDREAAEAAQERCEYLSSGRALVDDLFLPALTQDQQEAGQLRLGRGFVFWPRIKDVQYEAHTQADVYLTISAVLHAMRSSQSGGAPLIQHEHNRTVLDPANFLRYNDGVIQAALLRATESRELHYDAVPELSGEMFDLVDAMLEQPEHESSAAVAELLLALALRHVRLEGRHLGRLFAKLEKMDLPPLLRALRFRIARLAA